MTSAWNMTEDRFTPSQAAWRESVNTISNGYLSTRGSFEERRTNECRATFINGLFVRPPGDLPLLGAVPDWTDFQIRVDATPFDLDEWRPAGYRRTLDLRSGLLTRTVLWRGPETGTVRITFERILSMAQRHVAGLRVRIEALTDQVELEIETGVLSSIPSPEHPAWTPQRAIGRTARRFDTAASTTRTDSPSISESTDSTDA